jgi:hypothetical protein
VQEQDPVRIRSLLLQGCDKVLLQTYLNKTAPANWLLFEFTRPEPVSLHNFLPQKGHKFRFGQNYVVLFF